MTTLTSPMHCIPAMLALDLALNDAVEHDEFEPVIYLLDAAGAGFGYRYEWEAFGPFSTPLVRDLSQLTDTDFTHAETIPLTELPGELQQAVETVRPLIEPPRIQGRRLDQAKWLWLLAAVHFLERRSGVAVGNGTRAPFVDSFFDEEAIRLAKERLADFVDA